MCDNICKNCVWIAKLKHNFKVGPGWEKSYCCTLFPDMIIEVSPESVCEEFFDKVNTSELVRRYRYGEI